MPSYICKDSRIGRFVAYGRESSLGLRSGPTSRDNLEFVSCVSYALVEALVVVGIIFRANLIKGSGAPGVGRF
jgi:hypothetical protein